MYDLSRIKKTREFIDRVAADAERQMEERRKREEEEALLRMKMLQQGQISPGVGGPMDLSSSFQDFQREVERVQPVYPEPEQTPTPGAGMPTDTTGMEGTAVEENNPLLPSGFNQPQEVEGFWGKVWQGISNTLTLFDPVLLAGDVSKAFIYGMADGGFGRAFQLAGQQLREWQSYMPGGERTRQIISGEELARKLIDNYDEMSGTQRMMTALAMDLATDPLSIFGIAALTVKGAGVAARGAAKIPGAAGIAAVDKPLTAAAQALEKVDLATQRVLNPFNQAIAAAGFASRLPMPFSREAQTIGQAAGGVLDSILNIRLKKAMVDTPGGVQRETYITLGNFIFPHGSTMQEQREIFSKLPTYTGSPEHGPGSMIRAKAYYQEHQQRTLSHVEEAARLIHDSFGVESRFLRRKVISPELVPFVSEMTETAGTVIAKTGLADAPQKLQEAAAAVRQMARAYGVDEDLAEAVFKQYHDRLRLAYLEGAYGFTGMPLYEKIYKATAKQNGLDPDEAWQRYLGLKAGTLVPEKVGDAWTYKSTVEPEFIQEITLPSNPRSKKILNDLVGGKYGVGTEVRAWMSLNAMDQAEALKQLPQLEQTIKEYELAAKAASNPHFQVTVLSDTQKYISEMQQAIPGDPNAFNQKWQNLQAKIDPYTYWERLDDLMMDSGGMIDYLLGSSRKHIQALGYALLGNFLETTGRIEEALVFYGKAAKDLNNREAARFIYAMGAPQIGVPAQKMMKVSLVNRADLKAISSAKKVDGKLTQEIINILGRASTGVQDEVRNILSSGKGVYADLILGIMERSPQRLTAFATNIINGTIPSDREGVAAAFSILRQMGMENELFQVMQTAGKTTSMEQFRTMFAKNLENVEKEAIEEFFRQKPNWMGAMSAADLLGTVDNKGKWQGNPFSPLQWFSDVKNGYARKVYSGILAPEATMGALIKGSISLIPELDPTEVVKRAGEWMQKYNISDPRIPAATQKVVEYLQQAGERFAYSTNSLIRLLRSEGVNLSNDEMRSLVTHITMGDLTAAEAIRQIGSKLTSGMFSNPKAQMLPGTFRKRVAGADFLVSFFDPGATLSEFNRFASRNAMAYHVLEELYNDLKAAGMIFDNPDPNLIAITKLVEVPNTVADMGDGAKALAYGPLSGKWIPAAVWDDLLKTMAADPLSKNETFAAFLSYWRKALLNNHVTALVNIIGNEYLTWANMGPTFAMESYSQMIPAMRIYNRYLDTGELPKEISEGALHFLRETSLNQEVRKIMSDKLTGFLGQDVRKYQDGVLLKMIQNLDKYANEFHTILSSKPNTKWGMLMGIEVFSYMENVKRLANYLAAKRLGMKEHEAMWAAAVATYNYGELPYGIQMIRNTGLAAFPSFSYFTIKAAAKWATERPMVVTLPQRVSQASFAQLDEEEQARANVYMADWLKQSLPFIIPHKRSDGSYIAIPLASLLPIRPGSPEMFEEVVAGGVFKPFIEAAWGLIRYSQDPTPAGYPLFSAKFGDVLYREASTPSEAIRSTADYVTRQFAPTWMSRIAPGTDMPYLIQASLGDYEAYANLRSIGGRWMAQYTNPYVIAELERRTGRQIGLSTTEASLSFISRPRVAPQHPLAPGARSEIKNLQREISAINEAIRERMMRGDSIEDLRPRMEMLMKRFQKELQPYIELIERYGEPPTMPPPPTPPGGQP